MFLAQHEKEQMSGSDGLEKRTLMKRVVVRRVAVYYMGEFWEVLQEEVLWVSELNDEMFRSEGVGGIDSP